MSNMTAQSTSDVASPRQLWDRFWFAPGPTQAAARVRAGLCLVAALYFVSAWADAGFWLTGNAPMAGDRPGEFLLAADLESDARWTISPLFLLDQWVGSSTVVYYGYLMIAIGLCLVVGIGKGGLVAPWVLWLMFAGWANRLLLLAGVTETLLSAGLFAAATAPPASPLESDDKHWRAGFSLKLLAVQATLLGVCTIATMLSASVWWNGLGSYALLAPVEDRTLGLGGTEASTFTSPLVYESLTHLLVVLLPLGLLLSWLRPRQWAGLGLVFAWCVAIAVLGSHWLYGLTLASTALAIRYWRD